MTNLTEILKRAAEAAEKDGVTISTPEIELIDWVRRNVAYRPETEFFVVTLLTGELADLDARRHGFQSNAARAVARMKVVKDSNPRGNW